MDMDHDHDDFEGTVTVLQQAAVLQTVEVPDWYRCPSDVCGGCCGGAVAAMWLVFLLLPGIRMRHKRHNDQSHGWP
jgi:hypothetical protein